MEREWHRILDRLHDGVVHGLNGRVAGVSAVAELARMGVPDAELRDLLADEAARLAELAQSALRVPRLEAEREPAACDVQETLREAAALQQLLRRGELSFDQGEGAAAAAVPRSDVVRCVLLALAALGAAEREERSFTAAIHSSEDRVRIRLGGVAAGRVAPVFEEARAFAHGAGIGLSADEKAITLDLPRLT